MSSRKELEIEASVPVHIDSLSGLLMSGRLDDKGYIMPTRTLILSVWKMNIISNFVVDILYKSMIWMS